MRKTKEELELEITTLKVKYPKSRTYTITEDDGSEINVILRPMDREVYEKSLIISNKSGLEATIFLIDKLWIGGDDKSLILNDDENLIEANYSLGALYKSKSSILKKNY